MKAFYTTFPAFFSFIVGAACKIPPKSAGCTKPSLDLVTPGVTQEMSIPSESGVKRRKYRIHVPESYDIDKAVPLIFSFRGRTQDMEYQEHLSLFSNDSYGFEGIDVYPQGVETDGNTQWQQGPNSPAFIDDVTFTEELIDHLLDRYCIDPRRVYTSGKSNGGGFTGLLACDASATERIAAFAAVSEASYFEKGTQELPPCKFTSARRAIPTLELHGLQDTTIKYAGGLNTRKNATSTNIPAWVNAWAKRNGFGPSANQTEKLRSGEKTVTTYNWNETVVHYLYSNMDHDWPSQSGNKDTAVTTCAEADGTKVILDWFKNRRLQD